MQRPGDRREGREQRVEGPCEDCPAHAASEERAGPPRRFSMARRRFVDGLLASSIGGLVLSILYPAARYVVPPRPVEAAVGSVSLSVDPGDVPSNSGRIFNFGGKPGILIRTPGGELRAFSAVCTHLACTVQYRDDLQHIWCACHNGHYDLRGINIAGPPPRPLEPYDLNVRTGTIIVSRRS